MRLTHGLCVSYYAGMTETNQTPKPCDIALLNIMSKIGYQSFSWKDAAVLLANLVPPSGKGMTINEAIRTLDRQAVTLDALMSLLIQHGVQDLKARDRTIKSALQAQNQTRKTLLTSAMMKEGGLNVQRVAIHYHESADEREIRQSRLFDGSITRAIEGEFVDR